MKDMKKLMGSLGKKAKNVLRKIKKVIINKKNPSFYSQKGKRLLEEGEKEEAIKVFEKGLVFYPNSILIHKEFAIHAMDEKKWKTAVHHWDFILHPKNPKNKKKITSKIYIQSSEALKFDKQWKQSIKVLKLGLKEYPLNEKMMLELADRYKQLKEWQNVSDLLIKLFETESKQPSVKSYLALSDAYSKQRLHNRAEYILRNGIMKNPEHKKMLNSYAHIAVQRKDWKVAIQRLEYLSKLYDQKAPFNTSVKLSMLYQIIGNSEKANDIYNPLLNENQIEISEDTDGYRKIILFDNGESRIEFYKNLRSTNKVVMTFDSLNMVWKNPSFGFKLLIRQGVDVIALRKRKKKTYHQDLSKEDFVNAVNALVKGYADKIAYGFSLGAYSALYYASDLNCRILALSPRLSIHPVYGKEKVIPKHEFKHNLSNDYNVEISPIIVYDPMDKLDNTYVRNDLIQSFPNAQLVKIPYGGHSMAPHLLRMGVLKDFILSVINGEQVPRYDRMLKSRSSNYCRLLGRKCLRHNKIKWANYLSDRSIQLLPTDKYGIKLRVDVLKALGEHEKAIEFAGESVRLVPGSLDIRIILIDLYIQKEDLIFAEKELKLAIKKFKKTPGLAKREKRISEERAKVINTPLNIFAN